MLIQRLAMVDSASGNEDIHCQTNSIRPTPIIYSIKEQMQNIIHEKAHSFQIFCEFPALFAIVQIVKRSDLTVEFREIVHILHFEIEDL